MKQNEAHLANLENIQLNVDFSQNSFDFLQNPLCCAGFIRRIRSETQGMTKGDKEVVKSSNETRQPKFLHKLTI